MQKDIESAIKMTQDRAKTVDKYKTDTMSQMHKLGEMAQSLDKELMKLSKQAGIQ